MTRSKQQRREFRVFVSSPGDVQSHRDLLDEVVQVLNQRGDEFRLQLFKWEDDVAPQTGPGSQPVVDAQTPPCDIYLGLMSARFGTPTSRAGSGTEDEFRQALTNWQQTGTPWVMFYNWKTASVRYCWTGWTKRPIGWSEPPWRG